MSQYRYRVMGIWLYSSFSYKYYTCYNYSITIPDNSLPPGETPAKIPAVPHLHCLLQCGTHELYPHTVPVAIYDCHAISDCRWNWLIYSLGFRRFLKFCAYSLISFVLTLFCTTIYNCCLLFRCVLSFSFHPVTPPTEHASVTWHLRPFERGFRRSPHLH